MRARIFLSTLCTALALAGCAQVDTPPAPPSPASDFVYNERDAIPNDVPVPKPGVNQRPVVGTKTVLVTVTRWADGDNLNFQLIKQHTVSNDPDALPAYIRAASGGKLTLVGTIVEHTSGNRPYECIPRPNDPTWNSLPFHFALAKGEEAARANGLNPDNFDYLINVISCGYSGSASTPGRAIGIYDQSGGPHLYKHEFGHNLGYAHGATYIKCPKADNVVSAPGSCEYLKYGDTGDSVSGGGTLYPANFRWYSGWLDSSQAVVIEKSGLYRLAKLGNEGPQLYLINRTGLDPLQLALEYRKPTPFDNFPPEDNRVNGVWIRYTTMGRVASNIQVDGTPETTTTADPTFLPGKTLKDQGAGITVHVCDLPAQGTELLISVGINGQRPPVCSSKTVLAFPKDGDTIAQNSIVSGYASESTAIGLFVVMRRSDGYNIVRKVTPGTGGRWTVDLGLTSIEPGVYQLTLTPEGETPPITVTVKPTTGL